MPIVLYGALLEALGNDPHVLFPCCPPLKGSRTTTARDRLLIQAKILKKVTLNNAHRIETISMWQHVWLRSSND